MKSTVYLLSLYSPVSLEGTMPWMVCINTELIGNMRINYLKHSEQGKKAQTKKPYIVMVDTAHFFPVKRRYINLAK